MKHTINFWMSGTLAVLLLSSCQKQTTSGTATDTSQTAMSAAPVDNSNVEGNKSGVRGFYDDVINAHNVDAISKYCDTNIVEHTPEPGHSGQGITDMKASFRDWFTAMPDAHVTINQIMGEGDMVTTISTMTGTMKGDMGPMKATGKSCSVMGIDVMRLKNGKCTEHWGLINQMSMMQQLSMGGMPPPMPPGVIPPLPPPVGDPRIRNKK